MKCMIQMCSCFIQNTDILKKTYLRYRAFVLSGVILTIRRCLTDDDNVLKLAATHAPVAWSTILEDVLSTIRNIVFFILGVLSGRKTEEEEAASRNLAPSFGQMGEAIDGLIGALAHVQLSEKENEQKMALSDEHQVVLSCCWLNLKVIHPTRSLQMLAFSQKCLY